MQRRGAVNLPLHGGHPPKWLFTRMVDLSGALVSVIIFVSQEDNTMKATGIVRRIDDLGRVVIPKEIRRTLRIREGDPSQITLTQDYRFVSAMKELAERLYIQN